MTRIRARALMPASRIFCMLTSSCLRFGFLKSCSVSLAQHSLRAGLNFADSIVPADKDTLNSDFSRRILRNHTISLEPGFKIRIRRSVWERGLG
ncbi:hypothetical protein F4820DRAFT_359666 [Hypoxylon rubiginosum]|uniref:Uncharacterized protein n=1 Tax=Hypoxylon rubiginosum TaxID=110542 RepID=A0ACB9YX58_9PEZI|nr:hypothetical protein F4820DRAFT_359666 [Hypoxylon rubiginosum]